MLSRFLLSLAASTTLFLGTSGWAFQPSGTPADIADHALALAADGDYDDALAALSGLDAETGNSYAVRFARARILSWSGQYAEAEEQFAALHADYPDDPDVLLAYGYLAYYQNDRQVARERFSSVLEDYPDYEEARTGLARASRPQALPDLSGRRSGFRLSAGMEVSSFSRSDNDDWQQYYLSAVIRRDDRTFSFGYDRFDRFDRTDDQYGIGYSQRFDNGWDAAVRLRHTTDADFRPENSAELEVGKTLDYETQAISALRLFMAVRRDEYSEDVINNVTPGAEAYFTNGIFARATLISVKPDNADRLYGVVGRVTVPVTDEVNLSVGMADAPEAVAAIVIRTRSVFADVEYKLTDDIAVRAGINRDDRENSFIRESVNASLTHRF